MSPTNLAPPLAGLFVCERPQYRRFSFKPSLPFALLFQVKPDQLPPIFLNGQATAYLRKMFLFAVLNVDHHELIRRTHPCCSGHRDAGRRE
jgi:hypothetical protein